jgi:hypothetical protein
VGVLQRRHTIQKAAWDIGFRDSEKGSKTSHRASRGKAVDRTLRVTKKFQLVRSNRSLVSKEIETLKIVNEEYCGLFCQIYHLTNDLINFSDLVASVC